MHSFFDAGGRQWRIEMTLGVARRVLAETGVNLLRPDLPRAGSDVAVLADLYLDPLLMCDVLWVIVSPQANDIDSAGFGDLLGGDGVLVAASEALMGELADFYQRIGRDVYARLVRKQSEIVKEAIARGVRELDEVCPETICGGTCGASPEPVESTPSPLPSASSSGATKGVSEQPHQ